MKHSYREQLYVLCHLNQVCYLAPICTLLSMSSSRSSSNCFPHFPFKLGKQVEITEPGLENRVGAASL